jgi:hypothetical protein
MAVTPGERLVIGGRVVKPVRPSKYYRLRSCSKLTCKELLYGEVYFSSLKELTDPYDTKIYYRFKPNVDRYVSLDFHRPGKGTCRSPRELKKARVYLVKSFCR